MCFWGLLLIKHCRKKYASRQNKLKLRNYVVGPFLPPKKKQADVIMCTDVLECTKKAQQREHQLPHVTHPKI